MCFTFGESPSPLHNHWIITVSWDTSAALKMEKYAGSDKSEAWGSLTRILPEDPYPAEQCHGMPWGTNGNQLWSVLTFTWIKSEQHLSGTAWDIDGTSQAVRKISRKQQELWYFQNMFPLNPWRLSMDINIGYENIHHYTSIFQGLSYEPHGYKPHPWIYYAQWCRKLFSSCFSSKQFLQTSRSKKNTPGDPAGLSPSIHGTIIPGRAVQEGVW